MNWECPPTLGHDIFIDLITSRKPSGSIWTRKTSLLRQPKTTIEGNPEHDFGVGVILLSTTNLPDGHIGFCVVLAKSGISD